MKNGELLAFAQVSEIIEVLSQESQVDEEVQLASLEG